MPLIDPKNTQVILIGTSEIEDENFSQTKNITTRIVYKKGLKTSITSIQSVLIIPMVQG